MLVVNIVWEVLSALCFNQLRMEHFLAIFIVLTCLHYVETASCGPDGKCSCTTNQEMDCSRTLLPLREICEDTGNLTVNNISSLRVDLNAIGTIREKDLYGCKSLQKFYLRGNDISEIESPAFEGFHRLELLDLSNNSLSQYYKHAGRLFYFTGTLKTLLLNANINASVSGNSSYPSLGSLSSLSLIYLDGLPNKSFPDSYRKLRNLRNLTLSGLIGYCDISVVSNITFQNLPYLRELNISDCSIIDIHAGGFQMLSVLERLDLSLNSQLGFHVARNVTYSLQFTNIKYLNISKVFTTFGLGTQLTKRDICYLWNTSLSEIDLSSNRLVLFEINALILLPTSLRIIHIEDNRFTFTPYFFQVGCMSNVVEFYGNRQNSAHNPKIFFNEPDDQIPKADPIFDECPYMKDDYLRNISLSNKYCPFIEPNETNNRKWLPYIPKSLRIAHFSNCVLQYHVKSIPILPLNNDLEYLDFSDNVLSVTGPVGPLPKVKYLDLSRNYCSHIGPNATKYFETLENLQIQQNFIGLVLANTNTGFSFFNVLTNLKVLNLSSNIISYIPSNTFSNMTKLETLDLSINNIDKWTLDVRNLHNLKNLNLRFNSVRSLPESLRTRLVKNVKKQNDSFEVDLRNNSITCSCEEKDFLIWMVKYRDSMVGFNDYIFYDRTGTRISVESFVAQVEKLDKSCRSYVLLIVLTSIGVSVFLAIVAVGLIYRNRWKLRYFIRMAKIRHFGYKAFDEKEDTEYVHDAFISYADENSQFVVDKLVPYLESQDLELCLHSRDFRPGRNIIDNIMGAITNCKKTVAIISEDFVKSTWCMYEFNMARMDSIYSRGGTNCLVVVMVQDMPVQYMSNEMLAWIHANTYIEYTSSEHDETLVLQRLRDAIRE